MLTKSGRQAARLRPGEAGAGMANGPSSASLMSAPTPQRPADRPGHDRRHAAVHGPGADRRARGRRAHGPLALGRDRLRDGGGPAGLRGESAGQPDARDPGTRAGAAGDAAAGDAAVARPAGAGVPGEGPGRPLGRTRTTSRSNCDGPPRRSPRRRGRSIPPPLGIAGFSRRPQYLLLRPRRPLGRPERAPPTSQRAQWCASDPRAAGSGRCGSCCLSPDARHLAYIGYERERGQVYLRALDEREERPIAGSDGASSLVFRRTADGFAFSRAPR